MSTSRCPSRWWLPPRSHSTSRHGLPLWSYIPSFSFHPHHTRSILPTSHRSSTPSPPDPPWHALYVRSRVPLLSRFCMQGEQPRRRTVASTRKREHERGTKRERERERERRGRGGREKSSKGTKDARMH